MKRIGILFLLASSINCVAFFADSLKITPLLAIIPSLWLLILAHPHFIVIP